jgi:hypothetical protein
MKTEGMQVKTKRKFKATPYSDHDDPIAPNLLNRALTVDTPDTCYGDVLILSAIDQPTTRREYKSMTVARYNQPSLVAR